MNCNQDTHIVLYMASQPPFAAEMSSAFHHHARCLLNILKDWQQAKCSTLTQIRPHGCFPPLPIFGFAFAAAIGVVSVGGSCADSSRTLDSIEAGIECIRELARFSRSALTTAHLCEQRALRFKAAVENAAEGISDNKDARHDGPMMPQTGLHNDCIYGTDIKA